MCTLVGKHSARHAMPQAPPSGDSTTTPTVPAAFARARDTRVLQPLDVVTTLHDVHGKLWVGSRRPAVTAACDGSSPAGQTQRTSAATAATPQQQAEAQPADASDDAQLASVRQLQARMLAQVQCYDQQLAPAIAQLQPHYESLQLIPARHIPWEAVFQASRGGGCRFVVSEPHTASSRAAAALAAVRTAAAAAAGAAGQLPAARGDGPAQQRAARHAGPADHPLEGLVHRLEAACDAVLAGEAPARQSSDAQASACGAPASTPPAAAAGALRRHRSKQQHMEQQCINSHGRAGRSLQHSSQASVSSKGPSKALQHAVCAEQPPQAAAAAAAFAAVVATSTAQHMQVYRERVQHAQQQLLTHELAGRAGSRGGGRAAVAHAAASSRPSATPVTTAQLVALLAQQDARAEQPPPDEDAAVQEQASAAATDGMAASRTAAASERLAAAMQLHDLLAAAEEHVALAAQESALRLNISGIAKVHRLGRAWRAEASARSGHSDGSASTPAAHSSSSGPSTSRSTLGDTPHDRPPRMPQPLTAARCSAGVFDCADGTPAGRDEPKQQQQQHPQAPVSGSSAAADPGASTRPPAACVRPCPMLQQPGAAELAELPLPCLPQLLDLSHEPVKVLQARLERVWGVLGTPPEQQLGMVLQHTARSCVNSFEAVLAAWETAAAAVLQREALLEQVLQVKAALQQWRRGIAHDQQQQQPDPEDEQQTSVTALCCTSSSRLSVPWVQQVLWAFLAATHQVSAAALHLAAVTDHPQLLVDGQVYPPPGAVVSAQQLQPILEEAWELLGRA